MHHRHIHLLEKLQVQLAAVSALAVVYFAVWPILRPWDPQGPVTFLPGDHFPDLATFAGVLWALAAACAVATISSRPEGALLAALIGAAGVSLRSESIRGLLWTWPGSFSSLFLELMVEVLLLFVILLVAAIIISAVRRAIASINPKLVWKDRLSELLQEQPGPKAKAKGPEFSGPIETYFLPRLLRLLGATGKAGGPSTRFISPLALVRCIACLVLGVIIALALLLLLMRSGDRGQILFALVASFFLAALVAHQVFPAPYGLVAWLTPAVAAMALYALAAASSIGGGPQAWMDIKPYAQALPVDWLTAGAGGALIGYWISERTYESRLLEQREEHKSQ